MMRPSGMFELPPEISAHITSLHKEMEEMVRVGGVVGGVRVYSMNAWSYICQCCGARECSVL